MLPLFPTTGPNTGDSLAIIETRNKYDYDDTCAAFRLAEVMPNGSYFPMTSGSLRPLSVTMVIRVLRLPFLSRRDNKLSASVRVHRRMDDGGVTMASRKPDKARHGTQERS
jgi:hypothetical protein